MTEPLAPGPSAELFWVKFPPVITMLLVFFDIIGSSVLKLWEIELGTRGLQMKAL